MYANNNEIIYSLENIHHALSPGTISGVYALTCSIKVKASDWQDCLEEISELCAMKWVVFSSNKQPTSMDTQEALQKKIRMRYSDKFICHRSGSYASVARDEGRPTKKKSMKAGCTASLSIKCYFTEPEVYHFIPVVQEHAFHIPGDQVDDLRCLPLSRRYLWKIQNELEHSSKSARQMSEETGFARML